MAVLTDGRNKVKNTALVLVQGLDEVIRLEGRHCGQTGALAQLGQHDHGQAVDVEEGQHGGQGVLELQRIDGQRILQLLTVAADVVVRQHHALRHARGARREGQEDHIIGVDILGRTQFIVAHILRAHHLKEVDGTRRQRLIRCAAHHCNGHLLARQLTCLHQCAIALDTAYQELSIAERQLTCNFICKWGRESGKEREREKERSLG